MIDVLDLLAAGLTREQILEELPDLEPKDITAALQFAVRKLDHPVLPGQLNADRNRIAAARTSILTPGAIAGPAHCGYGIVEPGFNPYTMSNRPRRSVLYLPGSNARALDKARSLPADALILDLEDAVAPDAKVTARQQVLDTLSQGGYAPREVVIRVNGLDTPWGRDDLRAAATSGADAVLLPKVDQPQQITFAAEILARAGASDRMALWIMLETPFGVLNAVSIAAAHPRVQVLVMGNEDLGHALRVRADDDRAGLITAMSQCILAARAHGREILDGVYTALDDPDGLERVCVQGRRLGFDGKTLIHPRQIDTANRVFGPDTEAVERARRIVAAWDQVGGKGVIVLDGRMIEHLHVSEARRILALAERIDALVRD